VIHRTCACGKPCINRHQCRECAREARIEREEVVRLSMSSMANKSRVDPAVPLPCRACGAMVLPTPSGDCEECQHREPSVHYSAMALELAAESHAIYGQTMPGGKLALVADRS
jgi:DNA-directed RNA polymerase subunit M/transcription elongation factor TFIIS